MVEQVLLNLTRNAMQAMEPPEVAERVLELRIARLAESTGWIEFSVSDRGPGIPADVAERLFTPFFTTKDEGMGLGLSLCRTVVEQHGGLLSYAANPPQGTVFRFTLPISE
jgi:two-component system sensor histidine kinase DctS